jgi:hypothetical protein
MSEVDIDICTLGETALNAQTNVMTVKLSREVGLDGDSEPCGVAPMFQCLGVTSIPAPPDDKGHAEGLVMMPCGPYVSGIVGGNDTRSASVVGQMTVGDTCLHGTHSDPDVRARVFCKDNLLAVLVGNDTAIVVDRGSKAITINDASGNQFEMSDANGIYMGEAGGAWMQLKAGKITQGQSGLTLAGAVNIGDATAMPIAHSVPLISYMVALEVLLTTIATNLDIKLVPTPGVTVPAVAAFTAAMVPIKTLLPTLFTKAS